MAIGQGPRISFSGTITSKPSGSRGALNLLYLSGEELTGPLVATRSPSITCLRPAYHQSPDRTNAPQVAGRASPLSMRFFLIMSSCAPRNASPFGSPRTQRRV